MIQQSTATCSMRLLEVVEACSAGVGRHVRGLCVGLVDQGHQLTVVYSPGRVDERFERFIADWQNKIRFVPFEVGREVSPVSDLRGLIALLRLIKCGGPFDVVHGHSSKAGAVARIAGRICGIPTVYTPNSLIMSSPEISELEEAVYTWIERFLGHWATSRIIAVSEEERDLILRLKLVPRDRVTLVENGIEEHDFLNGLIDKEGVYDGIEDRPITFGTAVRLSAQKAPGNLVKAFVQLDKAMPQVPMRLVIAGDGELFAEVKRQVEESGISDKISLLGWRPDIKRILCELDVFVSTSVYEGFPYSILEAMAAQLPIVSTDVAGTKEMLSGVSGNVLVPAGNPNALAEGMRKIVTLADLDSLRRSLHEIGKNNTSHVRSHFMQSEATRRTVDVYRALTS